MPLPSVTLPVLASDDAPEMLPTSTDESGILAESVDDEPLESGTENEQHDEVVGGDTDTSRYQTQVKDLEKKFGPNWYERVNGLQGSAQQAIERARAEETKRIELENRLFEMEIRDLPPEQQREAWGQLEVARETAAEREEIVSQRQVFNELARQFITTKISQKYGVPEAQLAQFNDPQTMETFAAAIANERKSSRKQTRKASGADRFEGGGSPSPAPKKQYNGDLRSAANDFAALASKLR